MNTLYNLSGFFRSLGTDASLAEACAFQLRVLDRRSLVTLRDNALDLVRIVELAIGEKDDALEQCGYEETRWPDGAVRKCCRPKGHNALINESDRRPHAFNEWEPR